MARHFRFSRDRDPFGLSGLWGAYDQKEKRFDHQYVLGLFLPAAFQGLFVFGRQSGGQEFDAESGKGMGAFGSSGERLKAWVLSNAVEHEEFHNKTTRGRYFRAYADETLR